MSLFARGHHEHLRAWEVSSAMLPVGLSAGGTARSQSECCASAWSDVPAWRGCPRETRDLIQSSRQHRDNWFRRGNRAFCILLVVSDLTIYGFRSRHRNTPSSSPRHLLSSPNLAEMVAVSCHNDIPAPSCSSRLAIGGDIAELENLSQSQKPQIP